MDYKLCLISTLVVIIVFSSGSNCIRNFEDSLSRSEVKNVTDHSSYRLPKEIVPVSYNLSLYTQLGISDFVYQGNVKMLVTVLHTTMKIVLHNDGLTVKKEKTLVYRYTGESNSTARIVDQLYDTERQFYIINVAEPLQPGEYVLLLHFVGEIRNDVFGFYRSSYDVNGETKWMGVTQFSPTYARRAFPCMDEPYMKAIFTLHIGHSRNQIASSNTEIQSVIDDPNKPGYSFTTFLPTPRMSTYLVGWIVHTFDHETSISTDKFRIWTRPSMNLRGSTALNEGQAVYSTLRKWLSIENPIAKMDQFAVPDFNFNAMENWGLITYRESVVLFENGVTPTRKIIDGLTTMAHEYAHTWFGNLVTPRFWDVVWLKEGFASYFQYAGLSMTKPSWKIMDKFTVDTVQPTLHADSADHNRTMNGQEVGDPQSIMATLDFVSYRKGASIIHMLSNVMKEPAFQAGLRNYLKDMVFKAAVPDDLYEHLQSALDHLEQLQQTIPIKDFMDSWTNQPGYPLVTVNRNYATQSLVISQERFYDNRDRSRNDPRQSKWWIPLNFATKSTPLNFTNTSPSNWLRPHDETLIIHPVISEDWIIFNVQQTGYYRINYDEHNWRMLIDYLRSKEFAKIHKVNRAALLDDAFSLARAGYIDYSIPFDLSSYLVQESEYEPWVSATNNFKFLNSILSSITDVHTKFQKRIVHLLRPIYEKLSFHESPHEDSTTKLHRELILSVSCSVNNAHCSRTSNTLFGSWISTSDKRILQDVKATVYCEGIRNGNETIWYKVWDRFLHTNLHTEQELLLHGLGCTTNHNLIHRYLNSSISPEYNVRVQYRMLIVNTILNGNPNNVDHALEFVRDNLERIIESRGYNFLSKVLTAIGKKMATVEQTDKLRLFVNENIGKLGTSLKAAKEAISSAASNTEWINKYSTSIANSLK